MKRLLLVTLMLTACAPRYTSQDSPLKEKKELVSILLVDRNGLSEAVANPDRLKSYQQTDFMGHQPYQKVLRVYNRDSCGDIYAHVTTYHPNGQVKQYLEVMNNRAFGAYKEWFPHGALKVEANVIEGTADITLAAEKTWIFDGDSKAYNELGTLIAEIPYQRGILEGVSLYFHPNGNIWKQVPYSNNQISGEMKVFLESGELFQSTCYSRGIKSGKSIRYWCPEVIASDETYILGKLMEGEYFSKEGHKVSSIKSGEGIRAAFGKDSLCELHEYHSGVPLGEVKFVNAAGQIVKMHRVKNEKKHGEELYFYPYSNGKAPQPKLSISWYEGKVQGHVRTWYENGVMENQRELREGVRNGVASAWYSDGQLMLIEEYEVGKLQKGDYFRKGQRLPVSQIFNGEGIATIFDSEGNFIRKVNYVNGKPEE